MSTVNKRGGPRPQASLVKIEATDGMFTKCQKSTTKGVLRSSKRQLRPLKHMTQRPAPSQVASKRPTKYVPKRKAK